MVSRVLFSHESDAWATPQPFFDLLDGRYHFELDPCASDENFKVTRYYTEKTNGLVQDWGRLRVFVNPPYGQIAAWVKKCYYASQKGAVVYMLIPSRTDTHYWHTYVMRASKVFLVRGRLTFGTDEYWAWRWEQPTIDGKKNSLYQKFGRRNSAPFPSALVRFAPGWDGPPLLDSIGRG